MEWGEKARLASVALGSRGYSVDIPILYHHIPPHATPFPFSDHLNDVPMDECSRHHYHSPFLTHLFQ